MALRLQGSNKTLIPRLEVANTLWKRMKGLIGREQLSDDQGLWIPKCNSVHTFFMRFPIDLVFVDSEMVVRRTFRAVQPGRLILPVWGATSVIECSAGFLDKFSNTVRIGEKLHVDRSLS